MADEGPSSTDDELSLPKATVAKMISGTVNVAVLPATEVCRRITSKRRRMRKGNARSGHRMLRRQAILAQPQPTNYLAQEFIHLISSEANEICEAESKKTIAPEHIISALKRLGFDSFTGEVEGVLKEHKQQQKDREKKVSKLEQSGLTPEELAAKQEELFAASRARFQSNTSGP
ncbi:Negative cofactor 2 complex subunit beta [Mycena kentingensis (nom. inval.)]|nr:Negative cofactor 2 complex subunit beta [Mycena kentingensis (nom. inval.)]